MNDCTKCKGTGIIQTYYNEVMDADGLFYDQNVQYELKSISRACSCRVEYVQWLEFNGYRNVRVFGNRWAGTKAMLFTTTISVGEMYDREGIYGRYCYHNEPLAVSALKKWDGTGDPLGWIARKGF